MHVSKIKKQGNASSDIQQMLSIPGLRLPARFFLRLFYFCFSPAGIQAYFFFFQIIMMSSEIP